jgi:NADP-dependent 3-hydroxy acid dehydrogenase YdfG
MDGLVLGASSGIATALLRERWKAAPEPDERWLLTTRSGVPLPELERAAGSRRLVWRAADAVDDPSLLLGELLREGWHPTRVLVAWGRLVPGGKGSAAELARMREVNGAATLRWLRALVERFSAGSADSARGAELHVAVLGSVAGDRPRSSMWDYSLSKQELERGVDELRGQSRNCRWTLMKPGPVATPMTAHMKPDSPLMARPDAIAPGLLAAWEAGQPVVYAPRWWGWISRVLGWVPEPLWTYMPF